MACNLFFYFTLLPTSAHDWAQAAVKDDLWKATDKVAQHTWNIVPVITTVSTYLIPGSLGNWKLRHNYGKESTHKYLSSFSWILNQKDQDSCWYITLVDLVLSYTVGGMNTSTWMTVCQADNYVNLTHSIHEANINCAPFSCFNDQKCCSPPSPPCSVQVELGQWVIIKAIL